MNKSAFFCFTLLMVFSKISGQESQKVIIRNNKVTVSDIRPEYQQIFPDFRDGFIFYKGMAPVRCRANYNFLLDEIHFLNEKGEKLALSNPEDLTQVIIENRVFVYTDKGYVEVIEKGNIWLVYKWKCIFSKKTREGAYGLKKDNPGIYQMNRISFDSREWNMDVDEEAVTYIEVTPYLKADNKLVPANGLPGFYKVFQKNKALIGEFSEKNNLDLNKETDLRRLVNYANSL